MKDGVAIEAMKATQRGKLTRVGRADRPHENLNAGDRHTNCFKHDCKPEESRDSPSGASGGFQRSLEHGQHTRRAAALKKPASPWGCFLLEG